MKKFSLPAVTLLVALGTFVPGCASINERIDSMSEADYQSTSQAVELAAQVAAERLLRNDPTNNEALLIAVDVLDYLIEGNLNTSGFLISEAIDKLGVTSTEAKLVLLGIEQLLGKLDLTNQESSERTIGLLASAKKGILNAFLVPASVTTK